MHILHKVSTQLLLLAAIANAAEQSIHCIAAVAWLPSSAHQCCTVNMYAALNCCGAKPLLHTSAYLRGCCGSFHTALCPTSTSRSDAFLSAMTAFTAGPQRTQSGHQDTPVAGSGSARKTT
eukprot:GHUV01053201.1.p1 GENE.GHUV01053201.1~~GHUV01053201.1.p1  ORF type:complete len:121 (+),score=15.25 GHUV01053201.1:663-1025(+)